MQLRDLSDAFWWIRRLIFRVDRLEAGSMLENSSISNGRMRFIGGLLLIDEGGALQVVGRLDGNGNFEWSGPWRFDSGNGEISGDVKLTGEFDLIGRLINGDIRIEGNRIHVGGMTLDPTDHGGSVTFPNGSQVFTDDDTIQVFKGNSVMQVSDDYARLQNGGNVVEIDPMGIRMSPAAIPSTPGTGLPIAGVVIQSAMGYLRKSDGT
ncbi:hypothetical protein AB0230_05090 [Microbacterium sp. NPDC089190]|uniref:hypothetical protein n=1 Tax=Microbacterium sp. NPDC089190 TaxID=3155063 RepID=UPI00344BD1D4